MAKGQKYINLTEYLKKSNKDRIELSFDELERIMKVKIPSSIFVYKTFGPNFNHSFSYGWSLAGYSAKANFNTNKVIFIKNGVIRKINIQFMKEKHHIRTLASKDIKVLDFYNKLQTDKNDRYKSWEHCYHFFTKNRKK